MNSTLVSFAAGLIAAILLCALGFALWRRKHREQEPEVRDAPLPERAGTSDPFAQHWSQRLLDIIAWKRYEELVAAYIREVGFATKTVAIGSDGVLVMEGYEPGATAPVMLVHCKVWNRAQVDETAVRTLREKMTAAQIAQGAFFNTGSFGAAAAAVAGGANIDLVNGRELLERLAQLPLDRQNALLDLATEGEYATPTCPACGEKMVRRVTVSGPQPGVYFWGCTNYPSCKRTFPVRKE